MTLLPNPITNIAIFTREFIFERVFHAHTKQVLNPRSSGPISSEHTEQGSATEIVAELLQAVRKIKQTVVSEEGQRVNYQRLKESAAYQDYTTRMLPKLRHLNLQELGDGDQARAFWINIYNALTMHAVIDFGIEKSLMENGFFGFVQFFQRAAYQIGGHRFSLEDIEHGILRGNRGNPYYFMPHFSSKDERRKFVIWNVDERIHFALNCASQSCPPIQFYTAKQLDSELDMATSNFINQEVRIADGAVWLSQIFKWYRVDFGGKQNVIKFLQIYLPDDDARKTWLDNNNQNVKLKYSEYDWGLNK